MKHSASIEPDESASIHRELVRSHIAEEQRAGEAFFRGLLIALGGSLVFYTALFLLLF